MTALKLPKPDGYGNYWFGEPGMGTTPCIFRRAANDRGEQGRYFLSLGKGGIVFENGSIKEYRTPVMAMEDLNAKLGG